MDEPKPISFTAAEEIYDGVTQMETILQTFLERKTTRRQEVEMLLQTRNALGRLGHLVYVSSHETKEK